jgi:branched-chain amino acid transport system permease protein
MNTLVIPSRYWRRCTIYIGLIAAMLFPYVVPNSYYVYVMCTIYITIISVTGLNLILGYTGQLNLAHAGFYTLGAYTVGILSADHQVSYWIALPFAGLVTAALAFVAGLVSLRLKTHYFSIFTLCVGFIIYMLIEKSTSFTHGTVGIIDIPAPASIGPLSFESSAAKYYLALIIMSVSLWLMSRITGSLLGRALIAIRSSEQLAEAIGINVMRTKNIAFVVSCSYAGIAGGLYAGLVRFLDPSMALAQHNFQLVAYILIGGSGTIIGPLLGVIVLTWATQLLGPLQDYSMLIYGPLLVLLAIKLPRGLIGLIDSRHGKLRPHA